MQIRSASNTNEVNWDDPLNKGLTAWYPFKQKGGNVLRDVVGDNHGTLESSMTGVDWVLSPETKSLALDFDRANDYVDCGTGTFGILPGSYEMTLSAWCKVRTFEDFPTILSKTSVAAPYGGWQLNVRSDSRFVFAFNQSGSWTPLGTSSEFSTNEWYLVTATRWKGGHSIFVNGTLEGQGSGYGTIEYSNAADPVLIGRNGARSETLDGQVSDVRIYNRALSESEVHDLYVASRTGYKDQFKRRYFPVSLPAEEPPTETTTSGLIRLKSPKQTQPSYKAGYAKSASESASPELWDGLRFCVVPRMGEAPLFNFGSDSIHELTNSGGRWSTSAEGATLDFEANASHYALASYPVPFQMAAPYTLLTFIDREETASGTDGFPFAFGSSVDNDPIVGFDFRTGNGHGGFIRDNAQNGPGAFGDTGQSTGSFALISHASNDHRTYHNGVQKGVATNSIGTTTVNRVCMGALYRSSDALHYDGDIAFCGYWDRVLTQDELSLLAADPLAPFRQRRYAPFSLTTEEPPVETATSGLIRLKSPKQTQPSYKAGYAKSASESASPELWDGLVGAWVPAMGPTGGTVMDLSGRGYDAPFTGTWDISEEGWQTRHESDDDAIMLEQTEFPALGGAGTVVLRVKTPPTLASFGTSHLGGQAAWAGNEAWQLAVSKADDNVAKLLYKHTGFSPTKAGPTISEDTVYSFAFTRYGSPGDWTVDTFVDGSKVSSNATASDPANSNTDGKLGHYASNTGSEWDGGIIAAMAYDRALSPSEIALLYADPLAPFRQRRYAPVSLPTEEPPTETATSGLIRLKSPRQSEPSYKAGYAKSASESAYPELWDGMKAAWVPKLGNAGSTLHNAAVQGANDTSIPSGSLSGTGISWDVDHLLFSSITSRFVSEPIPGFGDGAFAVSFRAYSTPSGVNRAIIGSGADSLSQWWHIDFSGSGNRISILADDGTTLVVPKSPANSYVDLEWVNVTVQRQSGGAFEFHIDGEFQNQSGVIGDISTGEDIWIGDDVIGAEYPLSGGLQSMILHNRALSHGEIRTLHADPLAPFRQRRYAPFSLTTEEPPTTFNHWYALPGRIHRIVGSGVNF